MNRIGGAGAAALAPSVRVLTGLSALYLTWNSIGDAGAASLAPSIGALTGLSRLYPSAMRAPLPWRPASGR
jgi:hypothetical protein